MGSTHYSQDLLPYHDVRSLSLLTPAQRYAGLHDPSSAWFALGIASVIQPKADLITGSSTPVFIGWLGLNLVLELSLTVGILYGLWRKRSGTSFGDRLVWKIIL